ncbi:MAG: ribonuclease E/G [Rickettsiales bacterium]
MSKKILVDASYKDEVQVAVVENGRLENFEYSTKHRQTIKGNIYLAKVTRVEPSLQAAFIDYGGNRHGFVPFAEIHPDYYNIPIEDRQRIKEQNRREIQAAQGLSASPKKMEVSGEVKDANVEDEDGGMAFDSALNEINEKSVQDTPSIDENYFERIKQKNVDKYKVQEVIKRGQVILVQAIKEERGNKGAAFTTYLSLAGRFCVLMPNSESIGGVSRKITKVEDRRRLKSIIDQLKPGEGSSVIIRTIGHNKASEEIKRDFDYLVNLWNTIRERTLSSIAPAFVYAEDDILKQVIRDLYDDKTEEIVVDGREAYEKMKEITTSIASSGNAIKLKLHKGKAPIFSEYKINAQIVNLYSTTAETESGAYIVINYTEALVAIDVNSGKSNTERNIEETATKTNIEAAKEIARQIRLRDLSGLIVVDFIDMIDHKNKRQVEKILRDELLKDKAKVQVGHISNFGLLEMSRQRMKPSFLEHNTVVCNHCRGKGAVRSYESCSVMILKTLEGEISGSKSGQVLVYAAPETVLYTLNNKREAITEIEKKHNVHVVFYQDSRMSADSFAIEKKKGTKTVADSQTNEIDKEVSAITSDMATVKDAEEESKPEKPKRKWTGKKSPRKPTSKSKE